MLLKISDETKQKTEDFEVAVQAEPILYLKLRIEEMRSIELNKILLLYNGKKIDEDGRTDQLIGAGKV